MGTDLSTLLQAMSSMTVGLNFMLFLVESLDKFTSPDAAHSTPKADLGFGAPATGDVVRCRPVFFLFLTILFVFFAMSQVSETIFCIDRL